MLAPRGTPPAIVHQFAADLAAVVQSPDIKRRLLELGAEVPESMPPDVIATFVAKETEK